MRRTGPFLVALLLLALAALLASLLVGSVRFAPSDALAALSGTGDPATVIAALSGPRCRSPAVSAVSITLCSVP